MYFKGEPLFPFGHGLSYTTFKYAKLRTSAPALAANGSVMVDVDVTNTGKVAGDSVVELYAAWPNSQVARPRQALVGFQRVTLTPGETRTVHIPLAAQRLAYWNTQANRFDVEAVPVKLMVGESSADVRLTTTLPVRR
jgi:beta-glucosidase